MLWICHIVRPVQDHLQHSDTQHKLGTYNRKVHQRQPELSLKTIGLLAGPASGQHLQFDRKTAGLLRTSVDLNTLGTTYKRTSRIKSEGTAIKHRPGGHDMLQHTWLPCFKQVARITIRGGFREYFVLDIYKPLALPPAWHPGELLKHIAVDSVLSGCIQLAS